MDYEKVFQATRSPLLVLDTDLVIKDVNPAYQAATAREYGELVGRHMFDAFPDNPHDPDADGVLNLDASFQRVLTRARRDTMPVQKYDIPWAGSPTGFDERFWNPVNSPLRDEDEAVTAILHHVEDVTSFHRELAVVEAAYERAETSARDGAVQRLWSDHVAAAVRDRDRLQELEDEAAQLRSSLTSRATIDQAIGIVVTERRADPDDAFQLLVEVSQHTNIKLRDVAAALVHRAGRPAV